MKNLFLFDRKIAQEKTKTERLKSFKKILLSKIEDKEKQEAEKVFEKNIFVN